MKRIYVAGKYSDDNVLDVLKNIGRGQSMCSRLHALGYSPYCPWHNKTYVIDNPEAEYTVQQFYDSCMVWLEVSDAVLVLPGWEESTGTIDEICRAAALDVPIFYSLDEMDVCFKTG